MADNFAFSPSGASTGASDDVGGVHYPRVKIVWGPDGTVNDADVASGKSLPIQLRVSDGTAWTYGSGAVAAGTPRVTLATDSPGVVATVADDAVDAGDPLKIGYRAVAHGAQTGAAANDRVDAIANRHRILWTIGGNPGVITRDNVVLDADGAQTDAALVTVSAGSKIVVTQISAVCSEANTGNIAVRIGFGAANVPAAALAGTAGLLINGTFGPGKGQQKGNGAGILGVGADGEDLRLTCGDPAGGALYVTYSYYTIES